MSAIFLFLLLILNVMDMGLQQICWAISLFGLKLILAPKMSESTPLDDINFENPVSAFTGVISLTIIVASKWKIFTKWRVHRHGSVGERLLWLILNEAQGHTIFVKACLIADITCIQLVEPVPFFHTWEWMILLEFFQNVYVEVLF